MAGPCVLVIEPSAGLRAMIRSALEAEGYVVREAVDGGTALAERALFTPDLILQDLVLPDVAGLDLTRRLRSEPDGEAIPILAISGFLGGAHAMRIAAAGFSALLLKPIDLGRVVQAVNARVPSRAAHPDVGKGRKVLLVDSDPIQLRLLTYQMHAAGFRVITASTSEAALVAARADPPQVVISDVSMPGMDGFELCLRIRRDETLSRVRVLLLSVPEIESADLDLARQVGVARLISRPLRSRGLVEAALEVLVQDAPPPPSADTVSLLGQAQMRRANRQLGRQVSLSIELAQTSAIQAAQLAVLGGMADALTRGRPVYDVLDDLLPGCLDAAEISRGVLYLAADAGADHSFAHRTIVGFGPDEVAGLADLFGCLPLLEHVVATGTAVRIPSPVVPSDVTRRVLMGTRSSAVILSPLGFGQRRIGALLAASEKPASHGSAPVAFIRALAGQIGQAIALGKAFTQLSDALRIRDDFVTIAAHELRTPLTAARLQVQGLLRTMGSQREAESLPVNLPDRIRMLGRQLVRLEGLVDLLLDAARLNDERDETRREDIDLVTVAQTVIEAVHDEQPDAAPIELEVAGPVIGRWDADALRIVIRNLLANALKFSSKQVVEVAIRKEGDRAVLAVKDRGIGIAPQDQPRIFEKFERAVATHNYGGWGIGLWLARRHVQAHDGSIKVESRPDHGTTFTVVLPLGAATEPSEPPSGPRRSADSRTMSS